MGNRRSCAIIVLHNNNKHTDDDGPRRSVGTSTHRRSSACNLIFHIRFDHDYLIFTRVTIATFSLERHSTLDFISDIGGVYGVVFISNVEPVIPVFWVLTQGANTLE
ncbi:hypothetical protein PM082_009273 [Marasmius tenuissimus]|nr:hypothetical protein PM082_009273 [Marasmius tenuissimus]